MSKTLGIVLAQLNLCVGDLSGNARKLIDAAITARDTLQADLIVFTELSLAGYPPEDWLLRDDFLKCANTALETIKKDIQGIHAIIGHPHKTPNGLENGCSVIHNGEVIQQYAKHYLTNYGVFDDNRYFIPGQSACVFSLNGISIGVLICEDIWHDFPIQQAIQHGAQLIVVLNASQFEINKQEIRAELLHRHATKHNIPIAYVNLVGGQDQLLFDGGSMMIDTSGEIVQHAGFFKEALLGIDITLSNASFHIPRAPISIPSTEARIYQGLVVGVRDYVQKNSFSGVLIGLSGGIDSALTLAIAVDALGKENVTAVMMPSRYTALISLDDANQMIKNLDVEHHLISIESIFESLLKNIPSQFLGKEGSIIQQNLQARARGIVMMTLSNQSGRLVLITTNRSEMAVGYGTLYGDMAGGFAVLKDVPKMMVYQLSEHRNQLSPIIPERIITRAPTAELAPGQKDEDFLPPYPILDEILDQYIHQQKSAEEIIAKGFDDETVKQVIRLIHINEYKRYQAPMGIRINHKAFGSDYRYPVTSKFRAF